MQAVDEKMRTVLDSLKEHPLLKDHYLAGGTNLALRHGHRTSIDLDFFKHQDFDNNYSLALNQSLKNKYGSSFESMAVTEVGVFGFIDGVKVDFVNYPYPLLNPVENINKVNMASEIDISAMKIQAIINRGSRKDFYDIHTLLEKYPLLEIMEAYKSKYSIDNTASALQGLTYFNDAENAQERENKFIDLKSKNWETIKSDIRASIVQMNTDLKLNMAAEFYKNTNYPGKLINFERTNSFAEAFEKSYGIVLSKQEVSKVKNQVAQIERKKDNGIGY